MLFTDGGEERAQEIFQKYNADKKVGCEIETSPTHRHKEPSGRGGSVGSLHDPGEDLHQRSCCYRMHSVVHKSKRFNYSMIQMCVSQGAGYTLIGEDGLMVMAEVE